MMKFNEKYQSDDFLLFLQEFLPEDFSEKEEDIVINKGRYKVITGATVLGYCESLDLSVLVMDHSREKDPRVTITTDAFKILADNWIHRALVVFRNKDTENYRLSYLTITLDLNEKNKAVKKYSNARRYSFYLGANAKVRTPEQQLVKKGRIKDIDDLLSRFSVEVVNKQFYLEVAKYFDELVSGEDKNLSLPSVSQENVNVRKSFAVRLIGRLMFCWFLKQKKSESGQLIPDELLSSDVARRTKGYYHGILEPLFFEVLNTSIDARGIRNELFDKVPYLNGGLFNPQSEDYYELDRGTFFSKHINTLSINDQWFVDFFELLELYNFTIDENTVFDQELSVDPEMLGRIFENLLAEINPETGSSERKRTGSFYTPRQIVEYMVDQSLIEYFKTKTGIDEAKLAALVSYDLNDDADYPLSDDEKQRVVIAIETLKLLDPACGSGAYPIGALQKIVYILQIVDPDCKLWLEEKLKNVPDLYKQKIINEVRSNPFDYTRKLDVIKNSIFGVDIQPIAVDVSRLRCFLTLVVESEIDDAKPNRGIEPLPNLDFKFVCANTLIGLPKVEASGLFDDHSGITELSKIMSEYFSCNSQRKNEIRLKFLHVQKDILEKTISAFGKSTGELTLKLTTWNPFSNNSNSWFDPEWMFGMDEKFDVVIGNPPYVSYYSRESARHINADKELKFLRESYEFTKYNKKKGRLNLWMFFVERSNDLLNHSGVVMLIVDVNFTKDVAIDIRRFLIENTSIKKLVHELNEFDNVSSGQVILMTQKKSPKENYVSIIKSLKGADNLILQSDVCAPQYDLLKTSHDEIIEKMNGASLLGSIYGVSVTTGVQIGGTEAYKGKAIKEYFYRDSWDFKDTFPSVLVKSVQKYSAPTFTRGILFDYDLATEITRNTKKSAVVLLKYKDFLQEEKLYIRQSAPAIVATFGDKGTCGEYSLFSLKSEGNLSLLYVLAVLNSKLITYYAVQTGIILGKNGTQPQIRKSGIESLPIKEISTEEQRQYADLSSEILQATKDDRKADVRKMEVEIDELVMDLYGLNDEEKEIVRNS